MKKINEMTIEEKIGQLFCVGFAGFQFDDNLKYLIDKYKIGNVILFSRNIKDIRQLFILNTEIHNYIMNEVGIMPFISIDQEGGMVTRIMDGATFCPGNMTIATGKLKDSYDIGKLMGEELRSLGINMNLAPSLDVNNNSLNPVIGVRSYGDNPELVGKFGLNFIRGMQENGVIATAKHFPGHGDTAFDSHKTLPIISHSRERLEKIELVPFKKVLSEVDAIMSAHVFFPTFETDNIPATLSRKVITDLLRNELGFKGLIISDCMEMKAIDDTYTTPVGCVMGLKAGLDQVMVSQTFTKQVASIEKVYESVKNGEIKESEIDEKLTRILKLKEKSYKLMEKYFYGADYFDVKKVVDNKEHKMLAQRIVDASLSLIKGDNIDYKYLNNHETLVIASEPLSQSIAEAELSNKTIIGAIKELNLDIDVKRISVRMEDEDLDEITNLARKYKQVVVCTYNAIFYPNQVKLINKISAYNDNLYVLSTRNPYDIQVLRGVKNYLTLYEYTPNSVLTVAKWLKGDVRPFAKAPVNLDKKIKCGASVYVGLDDYKHEDNIKYIRKLKECNIESIFVSGHMPERNSKFDEELTMVINEASSLGIKVILDVSKEAYLHLDVPNLYGLRLDYGFSNDDILSIYNEGKYHVELNGSTITKELLEYLKFNGANFSRITVSHNFYPKKYTGLSKDTVISKNKLFHEYGLDVFIFIPSSNMHRPPMYEGLPTLEAHRDMNLVSVLSTVKGLDADGVIFGDSFASTDELNTLTSFDFDVVTVPILVTSKLQVAEKEVLKGTHVIRIDSPEYFTRSGLRMTDILPGETKDRLKYDITIDNVKFGRYQGEVNIMRCNLPSDERVNVIGKALINDLLLDELKNGRKYKFVIMGEYD